jgi:hypothetical protein
MFEEKSGIVVLSGLWISSEINLVGRGEWAPGEMDVAEW